MKINKILSFVFSKNIYTAFFAIAFLLSAGIAFAGVSGSAGPTYPSTITVGDMNVPISLQITNNSTDPQDGEAVLVTNIVHTPSCQSYVSSVCSTLDSDPGVFEITGALLGRTGTACMGTTFTASTPDAVTGAVQFTPSTPIILGSSSIDGDAAKCIIDFHVNVLKVPTKDSNIAVGIQTTQLARADFTAQTSGVGGSASGASQITITQATPTISTIPSIGGVIGTMINDTATLSGGSNPEGNVVFSLYSPADTTCSLTPVFTETDATSPYATSTGFASTTAGVYHWKAVYEGDANNLSVTSPCDDEPVMITVPIPVNGNIIIDKITVPTGNTQSFAFVTTGTGYAGFNLTDATEPNNQSLLAGTYTVSETAMSGWTSGGGVCDNNQTPASIVLVAGTTVTCTFTNTQSGHLIVQKTTNPVGDLTSFTINASGTGTITNGGAGTVTDTTDKHYEVTPGTYSVTETVSTNWNETSNTCTNVAVGAGETKTCLIVNTYTPPANEYCSPGYWKQDQHFDSYVTYSQNDLFSAIFGVDPFIIGKGKKAATNPTLLDALNGNGGGITSLARAAVGALLNASALDSSLTPEQVIAIFKAALISGDYEGAKAQYTFSENCPLN